MSTLIIYKQTCVHIHHLNLVSCMSYPFQTDELDDDDGARPLAESLLLAIADLLFCPDFTVHSHKRGPVSHLGSVNAQVCHLYTIQ